MRALDLAGMRFGRLVAVARVPNASPTKWECKCDCGNTVQVKTDNLRSGNTTSCGCQLKDTAKSKHDLTGQTFGLLTVLERDHADKNQHVYYKCKCACGNTVIVSSSNLKNSGTVSCGCYRDSQIMTGRVKTAREATEYETNIGKIKRKKANSNNKTTGIKGVCYIKSQNEYRAYITFRRKKYILKCSKDIEECIKARKAAEQKIYGNFLEWYEKECKKQ